MQMLKSSVNASFPLIMPFGCCWKPHSVGMCMIRMIKIRCVLPIAIKFRWISFHKRWFLRPLDVNAMQIMRENILFCWPMMSCFGWIISSHLFGLKNNQNESLFRTWMNVYLSIWAFHLQIWFDPKLHSLKTNTLDTWNGFVVDLTREFSIRKNYIISITTLYDGQCLKSERITNDLHQM